MIEVSFKCVIGSQVETTNWPQTSSKFFKTLEPTRLWRHRPITMTCSVLTKIMTYVQLRHFLEGGYVQKMGVAMPSSNAIARSDGWRGKKDKTKSDGKQGIGDNWQLQRGGGVKFANPSVKATRTPAGQMYYQFIVVRIITKWRKQCSVVAFFTHDYINNNRKRPNST